MSYKNKIKVCYQNSWYVWLIIFSIIISSCKNSLSKTDRQLLLFAETEDSYDNYGHIDYIDVHEMNTLAGVPYSDEAITNEIKKLKSYIIKFPEYSLKRTLEAIDIPCTHRFIVKEVDSTQYSLDLELKIPDTVATQILTNKDLGKEFKLNGLNYKLLKIEKNEAVLWTQDVRSEEERNRNLLISDRKPAKKQPSYAQIGDFKEYQQLSIDVISRTSKPLVYTSNITDFNHYVHYRKSDIEYDQQMKTDPFYIDLWEVYSNLNYQLKDKFKNLNLIHIRAVGDVASLRLTYEPVSKNKTQIKNIGTFPKNSDRKFKFIKPTPKTYETISNLTEEEIKKQLKIGFDNSKLKKQKGYRIYFSLPFNFHSEFELSLKETFLITEDNFSESLDTYTNSYNNKHPLQYISDSRSNTQNNFRFVTIDKENLSNFKKINGIVEVDYPNYQTDIFNLEQLPDYLNYNKKDNSLKIKELDLIKKSSLKYGENSYLIKATNKKGSTIPYFVEGFFDHSVRYYNDQIEAIEISIINKATTVAIPIELEIPKPLGNYIKNFDYDLLDSSEED